MKVTRLLGWLGSISLALGLLGQSQTVAAQLGQPPESATPPGPRVEAYQDVNVRSGPGTEFPQVGVLIKGQSGAILGRSPDGFWLKIVYVGGPDNTAWLYKDLVRVTGDVPSLPTIMPPPTPTLPATPVGPEAGETSTSGPLAWRLPTYTAPPPVVRPTFPPTAGNTAPGGFPPALVIFILAVLGLFAGSLSLLRRRG